MRFFEVGCLHAQGLGHCFRFQSRFKSHVHFAIQHFFSLRDSQSRPIRQFESELAGCRFKLITRLMGDKRVSPWVKLIPVGALIYLISPIDLIMGIPGIDALDDAAVLWLGSNLFVELCPQNVVNEHLAELNGTLEDSGEIVDAETTDVDK